MDFEFRAAEMPESPPLFVHVFEIRSKYVLYHPAQPQFYQSEMA